MIQNMELILEEEEKKHLVQFGAVVNIYKAQSKITFCSSVVFIVGVKTY